MSKPNVRKLLRLQKNNKKYRGILVKVKDLVEKDLRDKLKDTVGFKTLLGLPEGFIKKAIDGFLTQKELFLDKYVEKFVKENKEEIEKANDQDALAEEMVEELEQQEIVENRSKKKKSDTEKLYEDYYNKIEEELEEWITAYDPGKLKRVETIMKNLRAGRITVNDINRELKKKYSGKDDIEEEDLLVLPPMKKKTLKEAQEAMRKIRGEVEKENEEKYKFLKEEIDKLKKEIEEESDNTEKKIKSRDLMRMQKTYEKLTGTDTITKDKGGANINIAAKTIENCRIEYSDAPWLEGKTRGIKVAYAGKESELPEVYKKYFKTGFNPEKLSIVGSLAFAKKDWWMPTKELYKILCIYNQKQEGNVLKLYLKSGQQPLLLHIAYQLEDGRNVIQNIEVAKRKNEYKRQQRLSKNQLMEELAKSNLVSTIAKDIVKNMLAKILHFLSPNNEDFKSDSQLITELVDEIELIDDKIYDFFFRASVILAVLYNPEFSGDVDIFTIHEINDLQNTDEEKDYKKSERNKILRKMLYDYYYITHPNERVDYSVDFNPYNFTTRTLQKLEEHVDESDEEAREEEENIDYMPPKKKPKIDSKVSSLLQIIDEELSQYDKRKFSEEPEESNTESEVDESSMASDESSMASDESYIASSESEAEGGDDDSSDIQSSSSEVSADPNNRDDNSDEESSISESSERGEKPDSSSSTESWLKSSGESTGIKCETCGRICDTNERIRTMVRSGEDKWRSICFCRAKCGEKNSLRDCED